MEEQTRVPPAALVAYLAPLVVLESYAAPMVDGVTADVGSHGILYSQAYEMISMLPA